jgi:hypothetical protein
MGNGLVKVSMAEAKPRRDLWKWTEGGKLAPSRMIRIEEVLA